MFENLLIERSNYDRPIIFKGFFLLPGGEGGVGHFGKNLGRGGRGAILANRLFFMDNCSKYPPPVIVQNAPPRI